MTIVEELQSIISDMHKDAYGFRPRGEVFWAGLDTEIACREKLEELDIAVGAVIAEDAKREREAVIKFEIAVLDVIDAGAGDRETAIRWMMDDEPSTEHFEWENGLPFGYLKQQAAA